MPRRNISRCSRRGRPNSIEMIVEFDLCHGHVFGCAGWEIATCREFAKHWQTWGDEITLRWIEAYPGSRPFAMYVLGILPPCRWKHDNPAIRHPLRPIEGCTVSIPDRAWHNTPRELEHLVEIGVVHGDERAAAIERFSGRDPRAPSRYRSIADEAEFNEEHSATIGPQSPA